MQALPDEQAPGAIPRDRIGGVSDGDPSQPAVGGLTGVLLCGGMSRRMGQDKARLVFEGRPLIERSLETLAAVCDRLVLAPGTLGRYADLLPELQGSTGRRRVFGRELIEVSDRWTDPGEARSAGPLSGLEAALFAAQGEWVWLISCDLPWLEPELGPTLLRQALGTGLDACFAADSSGDPDGAPRAATGRSDGPLPEPLCGVYRSGLWRSARAALEAGERRVLAFAGFPFLDSNGGLRLPRVGLLPLDQSRARQVFNLNTKADWQALSAGSEGRERSA